MKENRYDDLEFFEKYRQMPRSVEGLEAAAGFQITGFIEPRPEGNLAANNAEMTNELRRPMFFIVSSRKKA